MNFALIVDKCKVESYIVKNNKAYKFKNENEPYKFHHSLGNKSFIGFWGYPFVFNGCFLNWSEWENELPDLDLDVIFVSIENKFDTMTIFKLRKKYPNAKIFYVIKELWNWNTNWNKRIEVCNEVDDVLSPIFNYNLLTGISTCNKNIYFLPQPVDIDYLYDHYFMENKQEKIFSYFPVHNSSRLGETLKFTEYISKKYNIPYIRMHTDNQIQNKWKNFLDLWTPCTFHFNLDPNLHFPGQQAMQCAALGIINIGGLNDSHKILFPDTYTNDFDILEHFFYEYINDYEKRYNVINNAWIAVNNIYSYKSVKNRFEIINNNNKSLNL